MGGNKTRGLFYWLLGNSFRQPPKDANGAFAGSGDTVDATEKISAMSIWKNSYIIHGGFERSIF
jgi:hypothetical protein